ncbi:MAG: MCP four helix bundle domain-containing protein, partial [Thiovulaceae bacterium]|nr:MCP four helix bundle domain-containing protein [Sulfurimonadaceae bacterium]
MRWLENMRLQTKLIVLISMMIVAMIILVGMGFKATKGWQNDVTTISDNAVPSILSLGKMRNGAQLVAIGQNRVRGLKGNPKIQEKMAETEVNMKDAFERIDIGFKRYDQMDKDKNEFQKWQDVQKEYKVWRQLSEKFNTEVINKLATTNDPVAVDALFEKMTSMIEEMRGHRTIFLDGLQSLYDINKDQIRLIADNAKKTSETYKQMFMIVAFISIVFALILSWLIIVSITRSIKQSVASIRDGAMQITSASDQVASSSSSLAQGASEQASSVEEV